MDSIVVFLFRCSVNILETRMPHDNYYVQYCKQVLVAARTLNAMPTNSATQGNMDMFAEAYAEEVDRLMAGVDAIIPLHDVVTVTGLNNYDQTFACGWRVHFDCFSASIQLNFCFILCA